MTCYPKPGKGKSLQLCEAFAKGAGGRVVKGAPAHLLPGPAAFYDVRGIEHLWRQAMREHRPWYYMDNAYFDKVRGLYFRVGKNAVQCDGLGPRDWERWKALGIELAPWRKGGEEILICAQSEEYYTLFGETAWVGRTVERLRRHTDRPLKIRRKEVRRALAADLKSAFAVVTFTSSSAVEAIIAGVPAFCTGRCASSPMARDDVGHIEWPLYSDDREHWAAALAASQWTLDEIERGVAWRALQ